MLGWVLAALLASPAVSTWYDVLLADAAYGRHATERAAFLILERDGSFTLAPWESRGFRHARFHGAIPPRSVAIVHTHPYGEPHPSQRDREEARRLLLPVVVVTAEQVSAVMPDGSVRVVRALPR